MCLIYLELDVWTNLVVISDVLLSLQFFSGGGRFLGNKNTLHDIITPREVPRICLGEIQRLFKQSVLTFTKRNVHVV